jgi:hypothetical protein
VITGIRTVGQELAVTLGTWAPFDLDNDGFVYSWRRSGSAEVIGTEPTYTLVNADAGRTITVTVSAVKPGYALRNVQSVATTSIVSAFEANPDPVITGDNTVGQLLTADVSGWSPTPTTFRYVWRRDGVAITGATSATYRLVAADANKPITVTVTASRTGFESPVLTSAPTENIVLGTLLAPLPTISGVAAANQTLTAIPGTWTPAVPATGAGSFTYQWFADGDPITGETRSTFRIRAADVTNAAEISVSVTGSVAGYGSRTEISTATNRVAASAFTATPVPTITGAARFGQTLTALPGAWTSTATTGTTVLRYLWKRDGERIVGAETATYVLAADDVGKRITVEVTGSRDLHATVTRASAPTAVVTALAFTAAPTPVITGLARFGETLSAVAGTWAPSGELAYAWKRDGALIPEADQTTYVLTAQDVGKRITVEVTASNIGYIPVTKQSVTTAVVAPLNFTALPAPTITGSAVFGQVLEATVEDWAPAADSVSYSWRYLGSLTILGTESTYELTDRDVGKALTVTVTGTKDGYLTRSIRSAPTSAVLIE